MDPNVASFFTQDILPLFWKSAFLWAPIGLGVIAWLLWIRYVNHEYMESLEWDLLEVKIPRDVMRSPAAMEMVLLALLQTGGTGTFIDRWWKGQLRAWFSLEIVSVEGNVYFFIRTQSKFRFAIESQIYAQYPSAEISEVDDYVKYTEKYIATNQWSMFGVEWKLSKEDAYPIKTYVDYGLDKANVDVEEKIDPLSGVIEMMGSLGKGEQLWVQILVQATQDRFEKEGTFVKKQNWVKEADKLIEKLIKEKGSKIVGEEKKEERDLAKMTKLEKDVLEAVERSTTKPGFDVGIRTMYLSPKDYFRPPIIQALLGMFRQFNTPHLNGFKIGSATGISYPWEGWGNKVENMKEDMFEAYMERGWFYRPNRRDPFVLNTEELATIFHFPGRAIETPTFERVESTKAEPPANLPM